MLTSFILLFMPSPTTSEFAFVSSTHIYPFPIILIPEYWNSLSLFYCSLILLDLIILTLTHTPFSIVCIASPPCYVHPVPDHASFARVLSLSCNAIVITEYRTCNRSLPLLLITAFITNCYLSYRFLCLASILILITDSCSSHRFSFLLRIFILVMDSCSCHGFLFLS